jgi:Ca-activated chloride channel family protein
MRREGPGYASAVAMEEVTLLEFNRDRGSQPKLVALYPPEGTFYSDNPFIVLDAPWVRPAQRQGAQVFQHFLEDQITPELAARSGFRPPSLDDEPVAPVSKENGVDPAQPKRVLGLPEPRVLDAVRRAWREDRKPANVLLVVDTSGSMAEANRLERAKAGLRSFFRNVGRQDSVGLNIFSDQITHLIPIGPYRANAQELRDKVRNLIADGGTAVYDATIDGFRRVRSGATSERINAVVVLTDGEDTDSAASVEDVISAVRTQGDSDDQVRVFTIAYSTGAVGAAEALKEISEASGGQAYEGDTEDIEAVYRSISSFF